MRFRLLDLSLGFFGTWGLSLAQVDRGHTYHALFTFWYFPKQKIIQVQFLWVFDLMVNLKNRNRVPMFWLFLPLLLFLVSCSNIPQQGSASVGCGYDIRTPGHILLDCVPAQLPMTFTVAPSATLVPSTNTPTSTLAPTSTSIPVATATPPTSPATPFSTPTRIAGPTNSPAPTSGPRVGNLVQAVVRNGNNFQVRVRDCTGRSEISPVTCPQAKIEGKDSFGNLVLVDFFILPTAAFRAWRIYYPSNDKNNVWVSITSDSSTSRFWGAVCHTGTPLLQVFFMGGYTPEQDILAIWWELFQKGEAPEPQSCSYPLG